MLDDRDDIGRTSRFAPRWSITSLLILLNVLVFVLQNLVDSVEAFPGSRSFALSVDGLRHGRVWQLITFQFLHLPLNMGGIFHLLGNLFAIRLFGPLVEKRIGRLNFLKLYLLSGTIGGLLQMTGSFFAREYFGGAVVGASAGAFGLLAALAAFYPTRSLHVFFLPFPLRVDVLLAFVVAGTLVGLFLPYGQVAHGAHLGGILVGFIFARRLATDRKVIPVFNVAAGNPLKITPAPE